MKGRLLESQNVKKSQIPESLRRQLSEGGKKAAAKLTFESRSKGGKKGWETRLAKARAAEAQTQEPNATTDQKPEEGGTK